MWEWPKITRAADGKRRRIRASRPVACPLSWIIPTVRPSMSVVSVSGAPQEATSGPSLLPITALTGA